MVTLITSNASLGEFVAKEFGVESENVRAVSSAVSLFAHYKEIKRSTFLIDERNLRYKSSLEELAKANPKLQKAIILDDNNLYDNNGEINVPYLMEMVAVAMKIDVESKDEEETDVKDDNVPKL